MRLYSDSSKAFNEFNLTHEIDFPTGLKSLIEWYKDLNTNLEELLKEEHIKNWEI